MARVDREHPIRCPRCGADRIVPLSVSYPASEHRVTQRVRRPVRAEVKCVECGHRTRVHPRALLIAS